MKIKIMRLKEEESIKIFGYKS